MLTPELVLDAVVQAAPSATEPAGLLPARQQMALSLGWHIVLACFGVAFPAMIFVMHLRGIRRQDANALTLAQRWAKVSVQPLLQLPSKWLKRWDFSLFTPTVAKSIMLGMS